MTSLQPLRRCVLNRIWDRVRGALGLLATCVLIGLPAGTRAVEPWKFQPNDRVVMLGNGLVENDRHYGYFETRLQQRFPRENLTFFYLGWSGDTIRAAARVSGFQVPDGFGRVEKDLRSFAPTVIFLAYGMNESFTGTASIPGFLKEYETLLKKLAPLKARLAILSPTYHEDLGRPYPDPTEHNETLRAMTKALKGFANEHGLPMVDLFLPLEQAKRSDPTRQLTTNGLLLTDAGYLIVAEAIEKAMELPPSRWNAHLKSDGAVALADGVEVSGFQSDGNSFRFTVKETTAARATNKAISYELPRIRMVGAPKGLYRLKIDDKFLLAVASDALNQGLTLDASPMADDAEKLRQVVIQRNELFYRRWRPYNDHSRHWGFIGGDFKLYDDEIQGLDKKIAELRQPRVRKIEFEKVSDK